MKIACWQHCWEDTGFKGLLNTDTTNSTQSKRLSSLSEQCSNNKAQSDLTEMVERGI